MERHEIICDRCGKVAPLCQHSYLQVVLRYPSLSQGVHGEDKDLCPQCAKDWKNFLIYTKGACIESVTQS
jgi:hypothetical protein